MSDERDQADDAEFRAKFDRLNDWDLDDYEDDGHTLDDVTADDVEPLRRYEERTADLATTLQAMREALKGAESDVRAQAGTLDPNGLTTGQRLVLLEWAADLARVRAIVAERNALATTTQLRLVVDRVLTLEQRLDD